MCRAVYIASDRPLPLVPFNREAPAFHVEAIAPDATAGGSLSLPHCYYAGSYYGCGCGFEQPPDGLDADDDLNVQATHASRNALIAYLRTQLAAGCRLEMLTGWPEDEQAVTPLSGDRTAQSVLDSFTFERSAMERFTVIAD